MICSCVYRDRFIRPSPSGPDSNSSWLIFRGARHCGYNYANQGRDTRSLHWMRVYLQGAKKYIADYRKNEPAFWKDLLWIWPRLNAWEKREGNGVYLERLDDPELHRQLQLEIF